jgi:hypothetical protein
MPTVTDWYDKGQRKTRAGARILQIKVSAPGEYVVLCDRDGTYTHPFVTWKMNDKGETFSGNYFAFLPDACRNFEGRN